MDYVSYFIGAYVLGYCLFSGIAYFKDISSKIV